METVACDRTSSQDLYNVQGVTQWRKALIRAASSEANEGIRELRHERAHLKDLQQDLAGVQALVTSASHLQAGGARLAEVVNSSTEAASSRAQVVVQLRDELHKTCEKHTEEVRKEEDTIAQRRDAADAHHEEALRLLGTYSKRLGLAITRVAPQTVRMSFSLLDQAAPEQEVSFILGLSNPEGEAPEGYCVSECSPYVSELPDLVGKLNEDANSVTGLPRFVCCMRRAFLKRVAKTQTA